MKILDFLKLGFLASLCGIFVHHFYTNPKGIFAQQKMSYENEQVRIKIAHLQKEVSDLRHTIIKISSSDFEQEKIMREDLQMSCTNEYVYLLR